MLVVDMIGRVKCFLFSLIFQASSGHIDSGRHGVLDIMLYVLK